jgi:hypothetical protein
MLIRGFFVSRVFEPLDQHAVAVRPTPFWGGRTLWLVRAPCSRQRRDSLRLPEPELDSEIGLPLLGVIANGRHEAAQERIAERCV